MRRAAAIAALVLATGARAGFGEGRPGGAVPRFNLASLSYSQSGTVWRTVEQLDRSRKDVAAMSRVLSPKFGTFEEASSRFAVQMEGLAPPFAPELLDAMSFELVGEAIGSGRVSNPVVPELRLNALMVGLVRMGLMAERSGWRFGGGILFGFGPEQRSDGVSTDLIDELEMREGMLAVTGVDAELSRAWRPLPRWRLEWRGRLRETLFLSSTDGAPMDFGSAGHFLAFRWQMRAHLARELGGWGELGPELLLGPQPIPVDLLPRTWDYVHRVHPLPEIGAMVGAGLAWNGVRGWKGWALHGGFFGGYLGGSVNFRTRAWEIALGNWGLESSAAYHGMGQRLWEARIGLRI